MGTSERGEGEEREEGRRETKGGGRESTERHMEDNPCGWEEGLEAKNFFKKSGMEKDGSVDSFGGLTCIPRSHVEGAHESSS